MNKTSTSPKSKSRVNNIPAKSGMSDKFTLDDNGVYQMFEDFNPEMAKNAVKWILEENFRKDRKDKLTLIVNSPGGRMSAMWSIVDIMEGSKVPVHTLGLGEICSCGFMTFIAGHQGGRVLTPNTSVMCHQYSWGDYGKHHELIATRKEQDLTFERMLAHIMKHTNLKTEKDVRKHLLPEKDIWLSHDECIELGVCDEVKLL